MTEADKNNAFDTRSPEAMRAHRAARRLLAQYNDPATVSQEIRAEILAELLGQAAPGVWLEPPFYCDYGQNIFLEAGVFANFNCVFLDGARITVGEGTLLGPNVQIYATGHPLRPEDRLFRKEDGLPGYRTVAAPVTIGKNVWIGGGAIVQPGVTIGDGATIGAGAVVTKDVPAKVFAAGNPCRVIRGL